VVAPDLKGQWANAEAVSVDQLPYHVDTLLVHHRAIAAAQVLDQKPAAPPDQQLPSGSSTIQCSGQDLSTNKPTVRLSTVNIFVLLPPSILVTIHGAADFSRVAGAGKPSKGTSRRLGAGLDEVRGYESTLVRSHWGCCNFREAFRMENGATLRIVEVVAQAFPFCSRFRHLDCGMLEANPRRNNSDGPATVNTPRQSSCAPFPASARFRLRLRSLTFNAEEIHDLRTSSTCGV
jgi:hypothetical protein